jgi:hypothetical protein
MAALLAACSLPLTSGCCYCRRVHGKITKLVSFNVLFLNNFIIPKSRWNAEHLIAFTGTHLESAKYTYNPVAMREFFSFFFFLLFFFPLTPLLEIA